MTEEDEEFNRIEREAAMRMEAVKDTIRYRDAFPKDYRLPKPWVGLTDEEIDGMVEVTDLSGAYYYDDLLAVVRAAEKLLKEKNE
jgi:hypothetical protein